MLINSKIKPDWYFRKFIWQFLLLAVILMVPASKPCIAIYMNRLCIFHQQFPGEMPFSASIFICIPLIWMKLDKF